MLKYICRNYMKTMCKKEVRFSAPDTNAGRDTPLNVKEFGEWIDKFCIDCDHRIFRTTERICPVCNKDEFTVIPGVTFSDENNPEKFRSEYLTCTNCQTKIEYQIIS